MKKVYILISTLFISFLINYFFYTSNLIDIVTGQTVNSFHLQWPLLRLFIEPFYAFAYHILTMERSGYIFALISWLIWTIIFAIIFAKVKKLNRKATIFFPIFSMFLVSSIISLVIFLPVQGPKIIPASNNYVIFDPHSHTISSRDAISNIYSSMNFHFYQGYTDFFITEHDTTRGFFLFPSGPNRNHVFHGIQIRTTEGISVLLLSPKFFRYEDFAKNSLKDLINLAHKNDMLVIMPHWWKWHRPDLNEVVSCGIDGFEIYNCGYRYITDSTRQELIDTCKKNNLIMLGSTDWHGYGYMTNVWSVIKNDGNKNLFELLKAKPQVQVIVHDVRGNQSIIRYIFEPFYAFIHYLTYTKVKYILSFYMIISFLLVFLSFFKFKTIVRFVSLLFALFFDCALFYFANSFTANTHSVILPETIIPTLIGFVFVWLILWGTSGKNL
jgi:hypothetical protein